MTHPCGAMWAAYGKERRLSCKNSSGCGSGSPYKVSTR